MENVREESYVKVHSAEETEKRKNQTEIYFIISKH